VELFGLPKMELSHLQKFYESSIYISLL
jgi:hypothetical protein